MSYLVLARKYRPRTFADVAGQEVMTRTLQGAIAEGRIGHAYLFCGPRGTGKTTSARIFAKALNCERGPLPEPCGVCGSCLAIDAGSDVDVVEIDAASHTGVDHIRDLRDQAAYTPMHSRFKIYVIDEVHMLSKQAFNALLKTLEEPPPHVKFLFATTEPEKVIETVLSRCQVLKLNLLREDVIAAQLAKVLAAESVAPGPGVVEALAKRARGSLRDALSLTDQLLALSGAQPGVEDVQRLAGGAGAERIEKLLELLEQADRPALLDALGPSEGQESELVSGLLRELRGSLVVSVCGKESRLLADYHGDRERLAARAQRLTIPRLQSWMDELLAARERMERVPEHARTILELALLELAREERGLPLAVLEQRLMALEQRLQSGATARAPHAAAPPPAASEPPPRSGSALQSAPAPRVSARGSESAARPPASPSPSSADPAPREPAPDDAAVRGARAPRKGSWEAFLAELRLSHAELSGVLRSRGRWIEQGGEPGTRFRVQLARLLPAERELIEAPASRQACEEVLARLNGSPAVVVLEDTAQRQPGDRDPFTRQVADLFGGQIDDRP
jgi:DNA polymerase III subunit gamma/tau